MKKIFICLLMIILSFSFIYSNENDSSDNNTNANTGSINIEKKLKISRNLRTSGIIMFVPGSFFTTLGVALLTGGELCQIEYEYYDRYGEQYSTQYWGWTDYGKENWYNTYQALYYSGFASIGTGLALQLTGLSLTIVSLSMENKIKKNHTDEYNNSNIKMISRWKLYMAMGLSLTIPSTIFLVGDAVVLGYLYFTRKDHDFYGLDHRIYLKSVIAGIVVYSTFDLIGIGLFIAMAISKKRYKKENAKYEFFPVIESSIAGNTKLGLSIAF